VVDAVGIRPVGLDRGEILLQDEPLRDLPALAVKLMGAVRGFAKQHKTGFPDQFQQ
jgi:hypothetical protein